MVLLLVGMRDNSCRERVLEALRGVAGVKEAHVSLIRAQAVVLCEPPCSESALVEAVSAEGYGATVEPE